MLQREHSAILSTFIKLPFAIKLFVLSIFMWPLKTGFTVIHISMYKCINYYENTEVYVLESIDRNENTQLCVLESIHHNEITQHFILKCCQTKCVPSYQF